MKTGLVLTIGAAAFLTGSPARAAFEFTTIQDPADTVGFTVASGVNDSGLVVGSYNQNKDAFTYAVATGVYTTIDLPGAAATVANGISNSGIIVGYTIDPAGNLSGLTLQGGIFALFTDPNGTTNPNHTAPTTGEGVNNSDTVVGFYRDDGGTDIGFAKSGNAFTDIHEAGSTFTTANGINDHNIIVGSFNDAAGTHGFVDTGGSFETVNVPGALSTFATGIDNAGDIVGYYTTAGGSHGFIDKAGIFMTVDDPNGVGSTLILGVNDNGDIVGQFTGSNGITSGFLATAVPEPGTMMLFSLPILGLTMLRRAKEFLRGAIRTRA